LVTVFHEFHRKLSSPDATFYGQYARNSSSAGAPPQTPLGKLKALPLDPLAGFAGGERIGEEKRKGCREEEKSMEKGGSLKSPAYTT